MSATTTTRPTFRQFKAEVRRILKEESAAYWKIEASIINRDSRIPANEDKLPEVCSIGLLHHYLRRNRLSFAAKTRPTHTLGTSLCAHDIALELDGDDIKRAIAFLTKIVDLNDAYNWQTGHPSNTFKDVAALSGKITPRPTPKSKQKLNYHDTQFSNAYN